MSRRSELTAKETLTELSRPGPAGVKRGDLAVTGTPGIIFAPRSGHQLPVLAFGHGWLQPPSRYIELFRHLASWGIVVVAPATHRGPFASHRLFAADLIAALEVCSTVHLGDGELDIAADRAAVGGHSLGGGCAVLAAASNSRVRAVITLAATETSPSAIAAAQHCTMPSLHLAAVDDEVAPVSDNAEPIAHAWAGPSQLRMLDRTDHLGFTDGRHWSELFLHGKGNSKTQQITKALLTAFLLRTLCNNYRYDELLNNDVRRATVDFVQENAAVAKL